VSKNVSVSQAKKYRLNLAIYKENIKISNERRPIYKTNEQN